MIMAKLFEPLRVGGFEAANRVVMAPLTRNRADPATDGPGPHHAEYYAQRASAGLIITEATQVSPDGKGYPGTPGIYDAAQVAGWAEVTRAVHDKGGRIFCQLWHAGRISHADILPGDLVPLSPSDRAADVELFTGTAKVQASTPRRMGQAEIERVADDFRRAAENAIAAGFDGVEIHGANGYLIDAFLCDGTNDRSDAYGGPVENRARFLNEILTAVTGTIGGDRTGLRLSPFSTANDVRDSDPMALFSHVIAGLNRFGLAYLHMAEGQTGGSRDLPEGCSISTLRQLFDGPFIANNGYTRPMATRAVATGHADMISFGQLYISNPDLAERLRQDAPLTPLNPKGLFGGGAEGYTDYPFLDG